MEPIPVEPVALALKWHHQFQFAGYYAAVEQGYYAAEGLEVRFLTPDDGVFPMARVLGGEAQYGVTSADLVLARAQGEPVVALAVIMQHSPIILLSRRDAELRYLSDFVGRSIMVAGTDDWPEVQAMFLREGIEIEQLNLVPHTWSVAPFVAREVDASVDYITSEPFHLQAAGVEPRIIRPIDYGVDFYGDTLFTTEERLRDHPAQVQAFRRASLRGWAYALEHVDEMIDLILEMPGVAERGLAREHLEYEAEQILALIQPQLVQLGHMNPLRWQRIADTYVELGMVAEGSSIAGLVYEEYAYVLGADAEWLGTLFMMLGVGVILAILVLVWNWNLRRAVREKIGELKRADEQVFFHAQVLDNIQSSITATDLDGNILYWGKGATALYGYQPEEVMYRPFRNFAGGLEPLDEDAFRAAIHESGSWHGEHLQRDRQGREFWTETHIYTMRDAAGRLNGYLGIDLDISERKRAELQRLELQDMLWQSQKMESIGRLAGGVAHDFNNMLGVILGHAELILESMKDEDPLKTDLEAIQQAARRSADLTRQLLGFARKQMVLPQVVSLNDAVVSMIDMLKRLIGDQVQLHWNPAAHPVPVLMDPTQLDQVLANLCVNAKDAMPSGGSITIATGVESLSIDDCARHEGAAPGDYACLTVRDTGCGMDDETLDHLFEPFFTTKAVGEGTGLGLATVYGIVRQNNGIITVSSKLGQGAMFKLYFPLHEGEPAGNPVDVPVRETEKRQMTILLVEDEYSVLRMLRSLLELRGFNVLGAQSADEAMRIVEEDPAVNIDLLLTDVVMPGMLAKELAERLRVLYPRMRCLFMSGYSSDVIASQGIQVSRVDYVQKPFSAEELVRSIDETMEAPPRDL